MKKRLLGILMIIMFNGMILSQIQNVAVVQNFAHAEIDTIQSYLTQMQLGSQVFENEELTIDSISSFDLVIWDDLSYSASGVNNDLVFVFKEAYDLGIPFYFIGDDLATSGFFLDDSAKMDWLKLIHLNGINNVGGNAISIIDTTHPVINGPFGVVNDFQYSLDIDQAIRTMTGEILLGISNTNDDVILANQDSAIATRTVTQNVMAYAAGDSASIRERKKLFKNAVSWLLGSPNSIDNGPDQGSESFHLYQNYPNPFNPDTKIDYQLLQKAQVDLTIYNIIGENIRTLVRRQQNNGVYQVIWDGKDQKGIQVPSGIYLYRLTAGNFVQTKKMILLR